MQFPRAVVFDLDGTLVDTFTICLLGTRHVFSRFLQYQVPDSAIVPLYGIPLRDIMARFAPDRVEAMVAAFEDYYLAHQEELVRPFPGVIDMLQELRARGYSLAILSNKRKAPGLRELRLCGLDGLFHSVLFLEDLSVAKPAPEALRQSASALEVQLTEVLYVGDSALDIQCAQGAGARSAAALWSNWDKERLLAQRPDYVLASAEELLSLCPPLSQGETSRPVR